MTIGNLIETIGMTGFDSLTGANFEIIYGAADRDSLVSGLRVNPEPVFNILVGGTGSNLYSVRNNATAIIAENSGSGGNVLFTNIISAGIDPLSDSFIAINIDGRHLYFGDRSSNQYVLLLDWQVAINRIEEFHFANGVISYEVFANDYQNLAGYQGNLALSQFSEQFGFPLADLGLSDNSLEEVIDTITARAAELEPQRRNLTTLIPEGSAVGTFRELIGTDDGDSLGGFDGEVIYGLSGNDDLSTNYGHLPSGSSTSFLIGGTGSDRYSVAENSTAIILEAGNSDNDSFFAPETALDLGNQGNTSIIAEIDNRHLFIADTEFNQNTILLDWQEPANRIETFNLVEGAISYEEFVDNFQRSENYFGNFSWIEATNVGLVNFERLGIEPEAINDNLDRLLERSQLPTAELNATTVQTIDFFRFRNTTYQTGSYVFVGEAERDGILGNADFSNSFELEGRNPDETINPAFTASSEAQSGMLPFYRLASVANPGTYLYVGNEEYGAIFAENSDQRELWIREGFDSTGEDIPEFYLPGVGSSTGTPFNRLQNRDNGTFLFASPAETTTINNNPNLANTFIDQGVAFHSL